MAEEHFLLAFLLNSSTNLVTAEQKRSVCTGIFGFAALHRRNANPCIGETTVNRLSSAVSQHGPPPPAQLPAAVLRSRFEVHDSICSLVQAVVHLGALCSRALRTGRGVFLGVTEEASAASYCYSPPPPSTPNPLISATTLLCQGGWKSSSPQPPFFFQEHTQLPARLASYRGSVGVGRGRGSAALVPSRA